MIIQLKFGVNLYKYIYTFCLKTNKSSLILIFLFIKLKLILNIPVFYYDFIKSLMNEFQHILFTIR